jgi:RNA polymerase sigma factor (sigma-70 family)
MGDDDAHSRTIRQPAILGDRSCDMTTLSDRDVINRIRGGDEGAFDALFRAWYPRLVGFAESLMMSPDVAEDVVSEVFRRIWSRHTVWETDGVIGAYLFRAVRNEAGNVRRRARRDAARVAALFADGERPGVASGSIGPDTSLEAAEWQRRVWAVVDAMPEMRRAAAHLRWQEGMDYAEIARILGTTSAAVQMHVSRALQALRAILGKDAQ